MFVNAIEKAAAFTFPLIISNRLQDGTVTSNLGSFVIINEEGWFITAGHIVQETYIHQQHLNEYNNYKQGGKVTLNPKWILNHSLWFGADHHRVAQFYVFPDNDLAIGKIENYDPLFVSAYPKFIQADQIKSGRSLCKLGFPFYDINATFENNTFRYDSKLFPIPRFPYEGMMTRVISGGAKENREILWIETSSPGLRGQSGGPIFDMNGNIWALQSMTRHIPLGFSPKIIKDNKEIEENQFINLSWGVHVKSILSFLDEHKVKYYLDLPMV